MPTCEEIMSSLQGVTLIQACDLVGNQDLVRLMTPFKYPDGDNVDVFVAPVEQTEGRVEVTDYGQTLEWLSNFNIDPSATKRRKQLVNDVCQRLDVEFDGWQIKTPVIELRELPSAMMRLGQACIRVADLIFTQRLQTVSLLKDEVEEFVADLGFDYEGDAEIQSEKSGRLVKVDFRVVGPRRSSLIQVLPSGSQVTANQILRKWVELRGETPYQFITIYNDQRGQTNTSDLVVLQEFSAVLPWDDRTGIQETIAS